MVTTMSGALREALKKALRDDDRVFLMGEDIAAYGGIYKVTRGLSEEFGQNRVIDTPMAEISIVGAGIGAAIAGLRPVVEIMYADFLPITMDQIANNAAKFYFLSGGKTSVPLVVRSNFGAGKAEGALQSQTPEAWFLNFPGLKVVMPSNPQDAYGLLLSSIYDKNPVLFLEHKMLYPLHGELDVNQPLPHIGSAAINRKGENISIVSCGLMLHKCLEAADHLSKEGISAEVIDIRTLKPIDESMVCESVRKTGRLIVAEENPKTGGWGLQLVESVVTNCFSELMAPPRRIASKDLPLPAAKNLEEFVVPTVDSIVNEARRMLSVDTQPERSHP
jgi:pyruvate/2-oxoglutarate/acetoin dehydrogenase E1 component